MVAYRTPHTSLLACILLNYLVVHRDGAVAGVDEVEDEPHRVARHEVLREERAAGDARTHARAGRRVCYWSSSSSSSSSSSFE